MFWKTGVEFPPPRMTGEIDEANDQPFDVGEAALSEGGRMPIAAPEVDHAIDQPFLGELSRGPQVNPGTRELSPPPKDKKSGKWGWLTSALAYGVPAIGALASKGNLQDAFVGIGTGFANEKLRSTLQARQQERELEDYLFKKGHDVIQEVKGYNHELLKELVDKGELPASAVVGLQTLSQKYYEFMNNEEGKGKPGGLSQKELETLHALASSVKMAVEPAMKRKEKETEAAAGGRAQGTGLLETWRQLYGSFPEGQIPEGLPPTPEEAAARMAAMGVTGRSGIGVPSPTTGGIVSPKDLLSAQTQRERAAKLAETAYARIAQNDRELAARIRLASERWNEGWEMLAFQAASQMLAENPSLLAEDAMEVVLRRMALAQKEPVSPIFGRPTPQNPTPLVGPTNKMGVPPRLMGSPTPEAGRTKLTVPPPTQKPNPKGSIIRER